MQKLIVAGLQRKTEGLFLTEICLWPFQKEWRWMMPQNRRREIIRGWGTLKEWEKEGGWVRKNFLSSFSSPVADGTGELLQFTNQIEFLFLSLPSKMLRYSHFSRSSSEKIAQKNCFICISSWQQVLSFFKFILSDSLRSSLHNPKEVSRPSFCWTPALNFLFSRFPFRFLVSTFPFSCFFLSSSNFCLLFLLVSSFTHFFLFFGHVHFFFLNFL